MNTTLKAVFAAIIGVGALGFAAAHAKPHNHQKPSHCDIDHDHRSHAANYYDYYPHDRYYRAGPYRDSGLSFSITFGNDRYGDYRDRPYRHRRYDYRRRGDHYHGRRNGYRGYRSRVVHREVYDTRYRARIVLVEEVIRTRRGPRLVCNVSVRGPEAYYVSERRVHRIARRDCSRDARIQVRV